MIAENRFRLAIINSQFGEKDIKDLVTRLHASESNALVFLLSPRVHDAQNLARLNIYEAIPKPFRLEEVSVKLRHAVEIVSLREALRKSMARVHRLEEEIRGFRSVEDEVKIPDLSGVDLKKETSPKDSTPMKEEKPGEKISVQADRDGRLDREGEKFTGDQAIEQIRKLDDLRKAGILTDDEFNNKKQELLKRI